MWTLRIFSRPTTSGFGTTTWRSKRPGRSSAGSSTSGRLVAAIRITPSFASKPSISTSSWLRVCSRSSLPPPRPAPRCRPTASISSMKMMQGAFFLPCSNMSRTRLAPTPTNISTKSEPEIVKNGTFASPAMARASKRLAGAGRPDQQHALRDLAAEPLELLRVLQELDDLLEFLLRLVDAGHILEGDAPDLFGQQPRPALAEPHRPAAAALHLAHEEDPDADQQQHREPGDQARRTATGTFSSTGAAVMRTPLSVSRLDQARIGRRIGRERAAVGEMAADVVALDRDIGHLPAIDVGKKVRKGEGGLRSAGGGGLKQIEKRDEKQPDDDPEGEILAEIIHAEGLSMPSRASHPDRLPLPRAEPRQFSLALEISASAELNNGKARPASTD